MHSLEAVKGALCFVPSNGVGERLMSFSDVSTFAFLLGGPKKLSRVRFDIVV